MFQELSKILIYIVFLYAAGFTIIRLFFRDLIKQENLFTLLAIAWGVGNAVIAVAVYLLASINGLNLINYFIFVPIFFGMLVLCIYLFYKDKKILIQSWKRSDILVLGFFLIFFFPLILDSLYSYLLSWDAVAIWMLKAKVFYLEHGFWNNSFLLKSNFLEYSHKSYPVAMPLMTSFYYRLIGGVDDQIVQLYYLFFYINTIFLFYGAIQTAAKTISIISKLLITLSIFIAPIFLIYAHNGYTDLPLGFIIGTALYLLTLFLNEKNSTNKINYLSLLVLISGFGAVLKNEGIAFFIAINLVAFIVAIKIGLFKVAKYGRLILCGGLILFPILIWEYVKIQYHIQIDPYLLGAKFYPNLAHRLTIIFNHLLLEFTSISKYGILFIPTLIFFILQTTAIIISKQFRYLIPAIVVFLQFIFYIFVYLITPINLEWQVKTSVERLLLQLLPAVFILIVYQMQPFLESLKKIR